MTLPHHFKRLALSLAAATLAGHASAAAPKNPIVLVHGFTGFDNLLGVDYWYGIVGALQKEGATVLVAQVNPSQTPEYRGEELIKQLEAWRVTLKGAKFNLIGHSQGAPTVRYAASVRPDLVTSATTIGGVNLGSTVADQFIGKGYIAQGSTLDKAGTALLKLLGSASSYSGDASQINAFLATTSMTYTASKAFNQKYPEGAPYLEGTSLGPEVGKNGVRYYSITGNANGSTNSLDLLDALLINYTSTFFKGVQADGLVQLSSQYWGKHYRTYPWNHLDEVNQSLGLIGSSAPSPKDVYRSFSQYLASRGL